MKRQATDREKIFQTTYLIKDLYSENIYNTTQEHKKRLKQAKNMNSAKEDIQVA